MRSSGPRTPTIAVLVAAIALLVGAAPAAANPIPAGGVAIEHASLDWTGSQVMQTAPPFGGSNYFSAGVSDGTEATYSAQSGNVSVYQVSASGTETLATYASRAEHITSGGKQLIRLSDGVGKVQADGSAKVDWTGSFSVNFYGGLIPFTITDPELVIGADGKGELTGTIVGCAGSMSGPGCSPLPAAPVTVAGFAGVQANPEEVLVVTPDYAGVEVTATPAQNRTASGWGAWPQSMVSYQVETGLSSYFYSSGSGSDSKKPPLPFTVDFKGKISPLVTTPIEPAPTAPGPAPPPTVGKARVATLEGTRTVGSNGVVKLARLTCPSGGTACRAVVPKHVGARIDGERYLIGVMAPRTIGAGKSADVRARLPKAARAALGDDKLVIALPIELKANGSVVKKTLKVKIAGKH